MGAAASTSSPSHPKPTMPPSIMVGAKAQKKDEGVVPLPTKWTKPKPTMPPSGGAAASTSSPSHPKPTMPPSIMVGAKVEQKDEGVVPLPTKWTKPKPTM